MIWTPHMLREMWKAHSQTAANNDCGKFVACRQNFRSNYGTLFAQWFRHNSVHGDPTEEEQDCTGFWYPVCSHGYYFPLAVYLPAADLWVTNFDEDWNRDYRNRRVGVSPTTRQHQHLVMRAIDGMPQQGTTLGAIRVLAAVGPVAYITHKLERAS